jgi:hypothetical protein
MPTIMVPGPVVKKGYKRVQGLKGLRSGVEK